jgi:hypothetical protein
MSAKKATTSAEQQVKMIQAIVFPDEPDEWDGVWGKKSQCALDALVAQVNAVSPADEGKGSWFSQYEGKHKWVDKGDKPNSNALGVPDDMQGIALPSRKTLGKWFYVTAPNGMTLCLQQTDLGPAKWTGRKIDIAAVAAERFGYSPKNFPTDKPFKWRPA